MSLGGKGLEIATRIRFLDNCELLSSRNNPSRVVNWDNYLVGEERVGSPKEFSGNVESTEELPMKQSPQG